MDPNQADDEVIVTESQEADTPAQDVLEQPTGETPGEQQNTEGQAADDDEVVVTIGEEPPPSEEDDDFHGKPAPDWVKELRRADREKAKRIKELEQKLETQHAPAKPDELGAKPTLESCDYDAERFEQELESWHQRKKVHDDAQAQKRKAEEDAKAAWQAKLDAYSKGKAELKVKDYEDAEAAAQDVLSPVQQAVILNGADNPAVLVYALGKNPGKAKELAAITDPVKFAFAVAKLETQLKVAPRKSTPLPERKVTGSGPVSGADQTLERLRAEADRTGDRSKVAAYMRQQKAKG